MTVHFIGAGPGDPELITVRGQRLVRQCGLCLYAGSLVPPAVVAEAPDASTVIDTAPLTLPTILGHIESAEAAGQDTARLHSGDPALYGAIAEQMRALAERGIAYSLTPGVPAFAAAAASLGVELTLPEIAQTIILTRADGKASAMPSGERLEHLAAGGSATLAIHLAIRQIRTVAATLAETYGPDCACAVVYRASWPDEQVLRGTLADMPGQVRRAKLTRTALILVGPALAPAGATASRLYDPGHRHILRPFGGDGQAES